MPTPKKKVSGCAERDRAVACAMDFVGSTPEEIGERLGIPVEQVKRRYKSFLGRTRGDRNGLALLSMEAMAIAVAGNPRVLSDGSVQVNAPDPKLVMQVVELSTRETSTPLTGEHEASGGTDLGPAILALLMNRQKQPPALTAHAEVVEDAEIVPVPT